MAQIHLVEYVTSKPGSMRVDREKGIVYGVKFLGWKSANGREYLASGVNPSLYEGRGVNVDHTHKGQPRSARDRFGWFEGVEKKPDGMFGNLHVLDPKEPLAVKVFNAAEKKPDLFGFSHVAKGREKPGSHGAIIEAVEAVESVDLVIDPATVKGLFESGHPHRQAPWREQDNSSSIETRAAGLATRVDAIIEAVVNRNHPVTHSDIETLREVVTLLKEASGTEPAPGMPTAESRKRVVNYLRGSSPAPSSADDEARRKLVAKLRRPF